MSPNRTWLVWHNHQSLDGWPFPAAAHLDGTQYREWNSDTRGSGFFLDDGHWIEQSEEDTPTTHLFDLQDAKKDQKSPFHSPQAKAIVAQQAVQRPVFVSIDFSTLPGSVEIATYRTEDALRRSKGTLPPLQEFSKTVTRSHND